MELNNLKKYSTINYTNNVIKKTNYIMSSFFFKKKQKIFLRNLFKFLHNKIGNLII